MNCLFVQNINLRKIKGDDEKETLNCSSGHGNQIRDIKGPPKCMIGYCVTYRSFVLSYVSLYNDNVGWCFGGNSILFGVKR